MTHSKRNKIPPARSNPENFSNKTIRDMPKEVQLKFKSHCALSGITEREGYIMAAIHYGKILERNRIQKIPPPRVDDIPAPYQQTVSPDTQKITEQITKKPPLPYTAGFFDKVKRDLEDAKDAKEAQGNIEAQTPPESEIPHPAITRDSLPQEQPISDQADPSLDPTHPDYIPPPEIWKDLSIFDRMKYQPAKSRRDARVEAARCASLTPEQRADEDELNKVATEIMLRDDAKDHSADTIKDGPAPGEVPEYEAPKEKPPTEWQAYKGTEEYLREMDVLADPDLTEAENLRIRKKHAEIIERSLNP